MVKIWYFFLIFSNFSLRRHVYKEHEKEKHTKCIHCDRMFLWPCDMEYHCDMQHKGTAPLQFTCDVCNKGNISVENYMLYYYCLWTDLPWEKHLFSFRLKIECCNTIVYELTCLGKNIFCDISVENCML